MELYQLRTFVIIAEEENLTRAAKRLYTTPSTLSMHLKSLEDELNVQLFTRTTRGMSLTEHGKLLHTRAINILDTTQEFVNQASALQEQLIGNIVISLNTSVALLHIPTLLKTLTADYPGITLTIKQQSSQQGLKTVNDKTVDMAFVYGDVSQNTLMIQPLIQRELVVAIPAGWAQNFDTSDWHELAAQAWVSVGENCPFHMLLLDHLDKQNLTCRATVQIDDERSRYELVSAGVGLSLLEYEYAKQGADNGIIAIAPVEPLYCTLSLVYRYNEKNQPLIHCLNDLITALFR